jgi:hypothetical protein
MSSLRRQYGDTDFGAAQVSRMLRPDADLCHAGADFEPRNNVLRLNQDFRFGLLAPPIIHPTVSLGAVSLIPSMPSDSAIHEGVSSGSSAHARTWKSL